MDETPLTDAELDSATDWPLLENGEFVRRLVAEIRRLRAAAQPAAAEPCRSCKAVRAVLGWREKELLDLKGPCSNKRCRLHRAHNGPCDTLRAAPVEPTLADQLAAARADTAFAERLAQRMAEDKPMLDRMAAGEAPAAPEPEAAEPHEYVMPKFRDCDVCNEDRNHENHDVPHAWEAPTGGRYHQDKCRRTMWRNGALTSCYRTPDDPIHHQRPSARQVEEGKAADE